MTAHFFLRLQRKLAVTDSAYSSELALLPELSHYSTSCKTSALLNDWFMSYSERGSEAYDEQTNTSD